MRVDVVTIFPGYLDPLALSLPGKAQAKGLLDLRVHDLRDWTSDRHRTVDDTPYGGGAGMVMTPEPWGLALDHLLEPGGDPLLVVPTPSGVPFTQAMAHQMAGEEHLVFACGRYEGIDQRVVDHARTRGRVLELSVGDYVLNGGEAAVLVILEAVVRLLPGFLGNPGSLTEESHTDGLLEYPVYTKPPTWRGLPVPDVLMSGDHARVAAWRADQSRRRTAERRPDLLHASGTLAPGNLPDDAELRLAVRGDLGELQTLQWACFDPALREPLDVLTEDVLGSTTFVVRVAGRLVGTVSGALQEDGSVWQLALLMVAPDLRGRGLGRLLLEYAEQAAPESAETYRLFTGAGKEDRLLFYRRAGYSVRGERPGHPDVVVLTKRRRR